MAGPYAMGSEVVKWEKESEGGPDEAQAVVLRTQHLLLRFP